jgi:hypothetical protein
MGYETMKKDTVEVLDGQTATQPSEQNNISTKEIDKESEPNDISQEEVELVEYKCIKKVQAKPMDRLTAERLGLVRDVTGVNEDGYFVKYNEDYSSWTPKKTFEDGYIIPVEEIEVKHICKNKCDSCEFDYKERSYV